MNFLRLTPWHAAALVAALALMLLTAADWYTTAAGEEARRTERIARQGEPAGPESGQVRNDVLEDSSLLAERNERNAWQATGLVDRVILLAVLAAIALALGAAALRAAGRPSPFALPLPAVAAVAAAVAAVLLAYRMIVPPGGAGGEVAPGAPLALVALGIVAVASALAARAEEGGGGAPAT